MALCAAIQSVGARATPQPRGDAGQLRREPRGALADPARAEPPTLATLFANVRRNYFWLYLNYLYFNVGRYIYLQTDAIFPYILLVPTFVVGAISFGIMQQILNAFSQVQSSFQYLVSSWSTIVDLISVQKRLLAFEATLHGDPLPPIESEAEPQSV